MYKLSLKKIVVFSCSIALMVLCAVIISLCGGSSSNQLGVAQAASELTTAKKNELKTTSYTYNIYYEEDKANPWRVSGNGLSSTTYYSADGLMEAIDNNRLYGGVYQDALLVFPDAYIGERLTLRNGNYYITSQTTGGYALNSKTSEGEFSLSWDGKSHEATKISDPSSPISIVNGACLTIYDCQMSVNQNFIVGTKNNSSDSGHLVLSGVDLTMSAVDLVKTADNLYNVKTLGAMEIYGEESSVEVIGGTQIKSNLFYAEFVDSSPSFYSVVGINNGGNLTLGGDGTGVALKDIYLGNNYGIITMGDGLIIENEDFRSIDYDIQNYNKIILNGDVELRYNGESIQNRKLGFSLYVGATIEVGAELTNEYYKVYIDCSYWEHGSTIIKGVQSSIEKFSVGGSYFGKTYNDTPIVEAKLSGSGDSCELIYHINYVQVVIQHQDYYSEFLNLTYEKVYIAYGETLGSNYEVSLERYKEIDPDVEDFYISKYMYGSSNSENVDDFLAYVPKYTTEVYIEWRPVQYEITFHDLKGGNIYEFGSYQNYLNTSITQVGETIDLMPRGLIENVDRSEYNWYLLGWATEEGGENVGFSLEITRENYKNLNLYPVWSILWEVGFYSTPDDASPELINVLDGEKIAENRIPTVYKNMHDFQYWYDSDTDGTVAFNFNSKITKNIKMYAKWKAYYYVTFDASGADSLEDMDAIFGSNKKLTYKIYSGDEIPNTDKILAVTPVLGETSFKYWYDQNDTSKSEVFLTGAKIYESYTFLPLFAWDITLEAEAGTVGSLTTTSTFVPVGDKLTYLADPVLEGYNFAAWEDERGYKISLPYEISSHTTLVATFDAIEYDITYILNYPGSSTVKITGTYSKTATIEDVGNYVVLPNSYDLTGVDETKYHFCGWLLNGQGTYSYTSYTPTMSNYQSLIFVAVWCEVWSVTYIATDADNYSTEVDYVVDGDYATYRPSPTRTGYRLLFWHLSGEDEEFNEIVTQDITLYASWGREYIVTLNASTAEYVSNNTDGKFNQDTLISTTKALEGNAIDDSASYTYRIPNHSKYTFKHWYIQGQDKKVAFNLSTDVVTSDITLVPAWVITISFEEAEGFTAGEGFPEPVEVYLHEYYTLPDPPAHTDYTFKVWKEGEVKITDPKFYALEHTTLVASYELTKYYISYSLTLPSPDSGVQVSLTGEYLNYLTLEDVGKTLKLPDESNLTGFNKKWTLNSWRETGGAVGEYYLVTEENFRDLSLSAVWVERGVGVYLHLRTESGELIEYEDGYGAFSAFSSVNGAYSASNKWVEVTLNSSNSSVSLPNVFDLFLDDNAKYVLSWYRKNGTTKIPYTNEYVITYNEALTYMDSNDAVDIYAEVTTLGFSANGNMADNSLEIVDNVEMSFDALQNAYVCIFKANEGSYGLITKSNLADVNFSARLLGFGESELLAVAVSSEGITIDEINEFDDILGLKKSKFELVITVSKSIIQIPTFSTPPTVSYNRTMQKITDSMISIPSGVEIVCEEKKDAGTYSFILRLENTDDYVWSDSSVTDKNYSWVISEIVIQYIYPSYLTYYYDGTQKAHDISVFGINVELDDDEYEIEGTMSATNAGEYSARLTLLKNYIFSNGGRLSREFDWEIGKLTIGLPIIGKLTSIEFDWEVGGSYSININDLFYGSVPNEVRLEGTTESSNAGSFSASLVLIDPTNYIWHAMGSASLGGGASNIVGGHSEPLEVSWKVNPKIVAIDRIYHYIGSSMWGSYPAEEYANHYREEITFMESRYNEEINSIRIDGDTDYITISGDSESMVPADDLQAIISLKYGENTKWECPVGGSYYGDIIINWCITKGIKEVYSSPEIVNGVLIPNFEGLLDGDTVLYLHERDFGMDTGLGDFTPEVPELDLGETNRIFFQVVRADGSYYEDYNGSIEVYYDPIYAPPIENNNNTENSGSNESQNAQSEPAIVEDNPKDNTSIIIIIASITGVLGVGVISIIIIKRKKKK